MSLPHLYKFLSQRSPGQFLKLFSKTTLIFIPGPGPGQNELSPDVRIGGMRFTLPMRHEVTKLRPFPFYTKSLSLRRRKYSQQWADSVPYANCVSVCLEDCLGLGFIGALSTFLAPCFLSFSAFHVHFFLVSFVMIPRFKSAVVCSGMSLVVGQGVIHAIS